MTYLDAILERRRADVDARKRAGAIAELRATGARRDFVEALRARVPAVIAEFKRSSPTAGPIAPQASAAETAAAYEFGGAAAISVLVEPYFFSGSHADVRAARAATRVPVLCKDFIIDQYQIWEAAAAGADAVLLIAAVLDDRRLADFAAYAASAGMAAIIEVHDEREARRAATLRPVIVGINNRDLHTFGVDLSVSLRVRTALPASCLVIGESGYANYDDVRTAFAGGIDGVLVGERFMRATNRAGAVRSFLGGAS